MRRGYVYFIDDKNGHIKIGTTDNIDRRKRQLQTGNALELSLVHYVKLDSMADAFALESILHHAFNNYKVKNEWYKKEPVMKFLKHYWIGIGDYRFRGIGYPVHRFLLFALIVIAAVFVIYNLKMWGVDVWEL